MAKGSGLSSAYNIEIDSEVFNPVYYPYLNTVHRYEAYYGGSGSGKSTWIGQKLSLQLSLMDGRNLVALRKQATDCKDSCYAEIYNSLSQFGLLDMWHIVEHPQIRMTNKVNGNMILFDGVDDIENIKSIKFKNKSGGKERIGNLTDVWYEEASEENDETVIKEIDRRLRDRFRQCRIIVSFNPVSATHWLKSWIERISKKSNALVLKTTWRDNKFLPKDYIQMLEDYQHTDPYSYRVYNLGDWGTTGQSIFNVGLLEQRKQAIFAAQNRLCDNIEFVFELDKYNQPIKNTMHYVKLPTGETTVYEYPQKNVPYVIAFDTAGEGSDYYAAHVIDNRNLKQVAVFHSTASPVVCIVQVYALALLYNNALLCPEINFDAYPLEKLKEWGYPNIYQRDKPVDDYGDGYEQKLGFRTMVSNRTRILGGLIEYVNNYSHCINDLDTIDEMLTFVRKHRKERGMFMGADTGAHDDLVMAYAIALEARSQQVTDYVPDTTGVTGFYFPEQIRQKVEDGLLDQSAADEYLKEHAFMFAKPESPTQRRSQYAR